MQHAPGKYEIDNHVYIIPNKLIKTNDDMRNWQNSEAYYEYLGFLYTLNDSIKGKTNEEGSADASPEIKKVCKLLDILESWIFEIFINEYEENSRTMAFREWYGRLRDGAIRLLQEVVPEVSYRAVPEIMVYLIEGFGNSVRCDYGTGHELSFLMFLCSLFKIGFLKVTDGPATACKVFVRYLEVVRKLQRIFKMDSIGSHGVWSLDDYQFVPFIWGSSQLIGNADLDPACFLKASIIKMHAPQYMFFGCIEYTKSIKFGPFAEHSNQLWNVSGVSSWSKVNSGLIRMYQAEILLEYPLVKNVYFGSIFTLDAVEQGASVRRPRLSTTSIHKPPTNVEFSSDLPINRRTLASFHEKSISDPDRLVTRRSKDAKQVNIDDEVISETESEISVDKNTNTETVELNQTDFPVDDTQNNSITSIERIKEEKRRTKISVEFSDGQRDKASVSQSVRKSEPFENSKNTRSD